MFQAPTLEQHLHGDGPKRILSLDGGGVRGLITLGMLKKAEALLQQRYGEEARICDYFDLIGGTSTGALISALLALGYRVDEIITLYKDMIPAIFKGRWYLPGIQSKFDSAGFARAIDKVLADFLARSGQPETKVADLRMNSPLLKTGLAIFTKRIDTGSAWVVTNNPRGKYWHPSSELWREHLAAQRSTEFFPNAEYSLGSVVRASASAPTYLDGVEIHISNGETGHFLDGAVSPFNNPCHELFMMTTLRAIGPGWNAQGISPHGFNWKTGADNLFLLSLGCGTWRNRIPSNVFARKYAAQKAVIALTGLIDDTSMHAIAVLQSLSRCPRPCHINSSVLALENLRVIDQPLLTFHRVNATLEHQWLETELGADFKYSASALATMRLLDRPNRRNLERLLNVGIATGEKLICEDDLP